MKRSGERPLRKAIEEFLDAYRLRGKMNEAKVLAAWEKVVGELIARRTRRLSIRGTVLYVQIDSAPLKNELMFARSKIIRSLNKAAGAEVIDDLVVS
jgi:predicted nucleic acid-binding Zn ribbon protein